MPKAIFELKSALYETKTIPPSYRPSHIIYTIMLIGEATENDQGIGRYKIKKALDLGEGSTKTLLSRLKEKKIIQPEIQRQKGHQLTRNGLILYKEIIDYISLPKIIPNHEYVVGDVAAYSILNSDLIPKDYVLGIKQRDGAIKVGGTGATCLRHINGKFYFPEDPDYPTEIPDELIPNMLIQDQDVVIIGGANNESTAILATLAGALSIVDF